MNTKSAPFKGMVFRVTSPYGSRPELGDVHKGIDLVGCDGDKMVTAVMDGTCIRSRRITDKSNLTWEWGNYVAIQQADGLVSYYCHLASRAVHEGQTIQAGTKLGVMGNTGKSYGAHLHFEVRQGGTSINPADYLGIPNTAGAVIDATPPKKPTYAELVTQRCEFEQKTVDYLNEYKWHEDLWRKLWEQMCLADIAVMANELDMSYDEALEGLRAMLREEML